jgi:hypothetical protein
VSTSSSKKSLDIQKRSLVMSWACGLGHKDCIQKASQAFAHWKQAQNYENR